MRWHESSGQPQSHFGTYQRFRLYKGGPQQLKHWQSHLPCRRSSIRVTVVRPSNRSIVMMTEIAAIEIALVSVMTTNICVSVKPARR